jgi:hypothetical protein
MEEGMRRLKTWLDNQDRDDGERDERDRNELGAPRA